ncbi:MAG: type II toxin-antitoxin system VapC family toxin, partial [Pyrinomonadaceae bacterium]
MDILLDTHVFLWMINLDDRIPDSFVEVIREPENSVFLSTASLWEIIIKYRLGRLPLPESPATYVPRQRQL